MKTDELNYGSFVPASGSKRQDLPKDELYSPDEKKNKKQKEKKTMKKIKKTQAKTEAKTEGSKVRFGIGAQLIVIITLIVSVSLVGITILVSYFVSKDTRVSSEQSNLALNERTASDVENRFDSILSFVGTFYDSISSDDTEEELQYKANRFFERNKDMASVSLIYDNHSFTNKSYFASRELDASLVDVYVSQESDAVDKAKNGETVILNGTPFFGNQLLALFSPIRSDDDQDVVVILFSMEALSDSFSIGSVNLSFLVNGDGTVLIHPDLELMTQASDFNNHYLVKNLSADSSKNKQINYTDENGITYIGAYTKIGIGGCAVITEGQLKILLAQVNATTRRNILLSIAVLSLAIIIVWFFSKSLSVPLQDLKAVTDEINAGNFETKLLSEMKTNRHDEIGVLINSTKAEQEILNTFTRLTNKGVTRAIVTKKIDFKPHLKDITIFFSDIRGFTAISDGFNKRFGEKSAAEIIDFLNDYMSRMVNCIAISGGTVDKFEGDAIMACWGVLRDDSLDYERLPDSDPRKARLKAIHEKHIKADAVSAIKATTAMRYALMEYNKKAEAFTKKHEGEPLAKYKPHIRIGSGLNSGRATVGFMGSYDKMEFTSIGDPVNLASRTESSNKPCGTDMLITEDTYNLLKNDFIRCEENNFTIKPENLKNEVIVEVIPVTFEVKGKGKQHFYGVVNMPQFDIEEFFKKSDPNFKIDLDCAKAIGPKGPKTLAEVRTLLGIPTPDFGGVNLDEEENKIKAT